MIVSELAKNLAIAPDTVRYYTRIGLIVPKINLNNGYKEYSNQDQKRLDFILNARQLGFSVKDIRQILTDADKGISSCPLVRKLIEKKLRETEQKFQQVLALRTRMQNAIKNWQTKPDMAPTSEMICHLIEDFSLSVKEDK